MSTKTGTSSWGNPARWLEPVTKPSSAPVTCQHSITVEDPRLAAVLVPDMLLASDRTSSPNSVAQASWRATARDRPGLPAGIVFVLRSGIPWRDAAERAGERLRHDLPAAFARLAAGRNS
jgi:hypothetical protein